MKKEDKTKILKNKDKKIEITNEKKEKIIKGGVIAIIVLLVLGLAFYVSTKQNGNSSKFEFVEITIDEYLEKMNDSKKSIIFVAKPGCSWCQKETPIIKSIGSEYNLTIHYLNTVDIVNDEEAYEKFQNSSEHYQGEWGTPNTIIVGDGKLIDGEFGYVEKNKLVDLFKRNGFINE